MLDSARDLASWNRDIGKLRKAAMDKLESCQNSESRRTLLHDLERLEVCHGTALREFDHGERLRILESLVPSMQLVDFATTKKYWTTVMRAFRIRKKREQVHES